MFPAGWKGALDSRACFLTRATRSAALFDRFKRRSFLQAVVAVAATTAFGCNDDETSSDAGEKYFPQSVCSGDPRPDSVVLWVRAVDPDNAGGNTQVRLEVSTSEDFSSLVLDQTFTALAASDHALKVKVTNLSARTTYYYRFSIDAGGQKHSTVTGRTRTAPAPTDTVPVKFVFASCQDYIGRYYNAWQHLLQLDEDLDFVVFLGDYIYETTGDASFQSVDGRGVIFSEPEKALRQGTGLTAFYAANSLSNYRDLYKNLRKDKVIQRVHERYPFIVTWDDHEFSDDCWGDVATYTDEKTNEKQTERRRNAEQAFFEYIPMEHGESAAGAIDINAVVSQPTRIYRDFEFGQNLKLLVTDTRTYRPDHLIPEDAYPGKVAVPAEQLALVLPTLPEPVQAQLQSDMFAYVDIDAEELAPYKQVLTGVYVQQAVAAGLTAEEAATKAATWITGGQALLYVNQVLNAVNQARVAAGEDAIPAIPVDGTPRGLAFAHMGKTGLFGIQGSRYVVVKPIFDLYAAIKYMGSAGASEGIFGNEQQAWLQESVAQATNAWKIIVSSISLTTMVFKLSDKADVPDPTLRQDFYFNVDQWDGFPTKKQEFLKYLRDSNVQNALFISGDIHASFASVESGIPALTAPAISSGSIKELAGLAVIGAGFSTGSTVYRYIVAELDKSLKEAHPGMEFVDGDAHGFVVLEVGASEAKAAFHLIPSTEIAKDYSLRQPSELTAKFTRRDFVIKDGTITAA
ncbi:alkaline phosphatase D family protein [Corallococcus macrosporus]|uniref:alkaline phosphatase D family protein n=1 Tax=Corallococcus macrosporus TaxID=35 RepID=UPI0005BC341E|nr:alkaline phosphatase D family protein [Corallococcus macrosporus]